VTAQQPAITCRKVRASCTAAGYGHAGSVSCSARGSAQIKPASPTPWDQLVQPWLTPAMIQVVLCVLSVLVWLLQHAMRTH
jgi:hypothetical protein